MTLFFAKFSENFFALPYRSNPCVDQGVDHSGHRLSNLKGVFSGKIDFSGMRMFVPGDPTSFANSLEGRRYPDCLDFLVKLVGFFEALHVFVLSVTVNNFFKTDSQKSTSGTRGKTNDGLSFVKNFFGVFWHIFCRSYAAADRVLNLFVFPKDQFSATAALCDNGSFWMKEVKASNVSFISHIGVSISVKLRRESGLSVIRIGFNNQFVDEHRHRAAVRAYIGAWHD